MKKTFTINGSDLKGFIQRKSKTIKLFAILVIAGSSIANAQVARNSSDASMDSYTDQVDPVKTSDPAQRASTINSNANVACPLISSLSMVDVSYNKVLVSWSSVMNYDSILFQFTPTGSGLIRNISIPGNPNPNQYHIQGLLSQTTYDIYVATVCNGVTSAWSAPLTVTTFAEPGPRLSSPVQNNPGRLHFVPNPASGQTKLRFYASKSNDIFDIRILAPTGNYIYSTQVVSSQGLNEIQLDLSGFLPGLYIGKLSNESNVSTEKLIVY